MKEQVKSAGLVMLVLLSIALTYLLWYGSKPLERTNEDVYDPVYYEEPRSLDQIVTPQWIAFSRGAQLYRLSFGEDDFHLLWGGISEMLQAMTYSEHNSEAEEPDFGELPWLTLSFQPPLPVGPGTPWLNQGAYMELREMQFWHDDAAIQAVLIDAVLEDIIGFDFSAAQSALLEDLLNEVDEEAYVPYQRLMAGKLDVNGIEILLEDDLLVPAEQLVMSDLLLKREKVAQDQIIKTFFVDDNLVRVISESDGSQIFTDGEKGLRIGDGLEYSQPQLNAEPTTILYPAALSAAGRLLGYYGGWPEWLRLEEVTFSKKPGYYSEAWVATWTSYHKGMPIYGEETNAAFNDSGMVEYQRYLYESANLTGALFPVKGYQEVLEAAYSSIRDLYGDDSIPTLQELKLSYWVDPSYTPRAVPVWRVRINEKVLIFCAKDLNLFWGGL